MLTEQAKVVRVNREDYGQGYYEERIGFCIGDRVFMVGIEGNCAPSDGSLDFCREMVRRWNANAPADPAL